MLKSNRKNLNFYMAENSSPSFKIASKLHKTYIRYNSPINFDYVIIDSPAGIEQGFKNAIAGADRALVVTTAEISAIRDADRIIGLLATSQIKNPELIINRIRPNMIKRGEEI